MKIFIATSLSILCLPLFVFAQEIAPEKTEDWSNKPPVVKPGEGGKAPSDALILFANDNDLAKWEGVKGEVAAWSVKSNVLQIIKDAGDIQTKQKFGSIQLHIEWMTPDRSEDKG